MIMNAEQVEIWNEDAVGYFRLFSPCSPS